MEEKQQPSVVKRIEPLECPHCKNSILIGMQSMMPYITRLSTLEDVKKSKIELLERIEEITFVTEEEKADVLKWINDEETLIDNDDVEAIEKNISLTQTQKISDIANKDNKENEKQ